MAKPRVLIVDDSQAVLRELSHILGEAFEIQTADNGQTAFEIYQKQNFDLILTDLNMPQMTGMDLCRAIKELGKKQPPIVVITSINSIDEKREATQLGVVGWIVKPYQKNPVLEFCRTLVQNS